MRCALGYGLKNVSAVSGRFSSTSKNLGPSGAGTISIARSAGTLRREVPMSEMAHNFGGITECINQITDCYARHDAAEELYFRSQRQMEMHSDNVAAVHHILSFRAP